MIYSTHTMKMKHPLIMPTICELRMVVRFLSAQSETVVNITRILRETYAEDLHTYHPILC